MAPMNIAHAFLVALLCSACGSESASGDACAKLHTVDESPASIACSGGAIGQAEFFKFGKVSRQSDCDKNIGACSADEQKAMIAFAGCVANIPACTTSSAS